jgi:uncharacterized protein YndB with AHSA1/START domain
MTLLSGASEAEIEAPIDRCWDVVADVASAPAWQHGLERLDVLKRDAEGRVVLCDTVTDVRFTKVRCRVRVEYDAPHRITFTRVSSDDVDVMNASWELAALAGGRTRAIWRMAVDPGPVGLLAKPLERALRPVVVGRRAQELAHEVDSRYGTGAGGPA